MSEREFLDQITSEIKLLRDEYKKRDDQMRRSRQMWMTIAGLLLAAAITLGATNITMVANHAVRIETLEERYRDVTPYTHFVDYVEFMNLKFRAFEALYNGSFPEKYREFSDQLNRIEQQLLAKQRSPVRGEKIGK